MIPSFTLFLCVRIYINRSNIIHIVKEISASIRRRIRVPLPKVNTFVWDSLFNMEGKIAISNEELGDGETSRVYVDTIEDQKLAVKRLKGFSPNHARTLIDTYEKFLHLHHAKVVSVLGLCPNSGCIILELCQKTVHSHAIHTLVDVMGLYDDDLPINLRILALVDVSEGLNFLHANGIVHGDLKPLNVLVSGNHEDEFVFKITDYASSNLNLFQLSHSTTFKQLMTPSYTAPELFSQQVTDGTHAPLATISSDIYSFGILAYEMFYGKPAWPNDNFSLIESVRAGQRPIIPLPEESEVTSLIQRCWQHNSECRPNITEVFNILDNYFSRLLNLQQCEEVTTCSLQEDKPDVCNEPDVGNEPDMGNEDDFTESNKHLDYSHWTDNDDADVGENLNSLSHLSPLSTSTSESDIVVLCNPSALPSQELLLQSSQRNISHVSELESIKGKLRIKQYKEFQLDAIQALQQNNDVIVVQPTGSGKSLCYTASALLNPGKITLVIEPIVAVITDQVQSLKNKGLDVVALGRAAGADKLTNFRRVFVDSSNLPLLVFVHWSIYLVHQPVAVF